MPAARKIPVYSKYNDVLKPVSKRKAQQLISSSVAVPYRDGLKLTVEINYLGENTRAEKLINKRELFGDFTECWECRIPVKVTNSVFRHYCPDCEEKVKEENEKDLSEYLRLRAKLMLDRALKIIERQTKPINILEYKEPFEVIKERIMTDYTAFDSADEIAAAMELLRNRIRIKIQQEVGKSRVDMMLPGEKVVLEIDGIFHEHTKKKDKKRDIAIRQILGPEWEVVRIPVNYLEKNIQQLLPAIRELRKEMQKLRKINGGMLPENFSSRDKAFWKV